MLFFSDANEILSRQTKGQEIVKCAVLEWKFPDTPLQDINTRAPANPGLFMQHPLDSSTPSWSCGTPWIHRSNFSNGEMTSKSVIGSLQQVNDSIPPYFSILSDANFWLEWYSAGRVRRKLCGGPRLPIPPRRSSLAGCLNRRRPRSVFWAAGHLWSDILAIPVNFRGRPRSCLMPRHLRTGFQAVSPARVQTKPGPRVESNNFCFMQ